MKTAISTLYALLISLIILILLYLVSPYVAAYPKITTLIFVVFMLTSFGAGLRSMIEMAVLFPLIKITNGNIRCLKFCPIVFGIVMLAASTIPWINGISGWSFWCWIASIGFTMFNFETFLAFVLATLRVSSSDKI